MQNHVMHTKDRMTRLQMETTFAVLGDDRRYPTGELRFNARSIRLTRPKREFNAR